MKAPGKIRSRPLSEPPLGQSVAMLALYRQLQKVAPSRHTVLITGESGTGKSRLATMIHSMSPRRGGPFSAVSCAALPRELLESELFGYEKGAFSGAVKQKPGRVELAHRGTLFLDEIGEMSLELQPKLLTFLQDHSFFRVGGHELHDVDVRLIAATNRDLREMVGSGGFREDLFYRLSVLPLHLPPLRERQDEIPGLALYFLRSALREFEGPKEVGLSLPALDLLLNHSWPGNIRELQNAMFRSATLVDDDGEIGPELIAPALDNVLENGSEVQILEGEALPTIAGMEKALLTKALNRFRGNKAVVAATLGISIKSVYNKIKQYKIGE